MRGVCSSGLARLCVPTQGESLLQLIIHEIPSEEPFAFFYYATEVAGPVEMREFSLAN